MNSVYITDYISNPDIERKLLKEELSENLHKEIKALLVWHEKIDKSYIDKLPHLKGIVRYGVGYDNVDYQYASEKGIYFCNTPDYGTEEVADTTIAMILNATRGLSQYDSMSRNFTNNSWQENVIPSLKRSSSLKIGIIGSGRIGSSVALRARSLRFQTTIYDPYQPSGHEKTLGATRERDLEKLLQTCDVITIHLPLSPQTKGLVDESFIENMKPGSIFISTARGKIVSDLDIFYDPLKSGRLFSVALDVLPKEPPEKGKLFLAWQNRESWLDGRLIINPHTSYYSQQSFYEMRFKAATNVLRILNDQLPLNIIKNPQQIPSHNQLTPLKQKTDR